MNAFNDLDSKIKIKFPFQQLSIYVQLRIYAFYQSLNILCYYLIPFSFSLFYPFSPKSKSLKFKKIYFSLSSKIIVFIITPNLAPVSSPFTKALHEFQSLFLAILFPQYISKFIC